VNNEITERFKLKEGWITFLFLFLAFIAIVWSIQGAGWVRGSDILTPAGILGFLVGFGLALLRFVPGIIAHAFTFSVGLVTVSFFSFPYGDPKILDWWSKLGNTVTRIYRWSETAFAGRPQEDKLVALVFLGLIVWLVGYACTWLVFRRHWTWLAVAISGAALIVNLSYSPPNSRFSFVIWILASLVVVVRMSYYKNEERWKNLRYRYKPGLVLNSLVVGVILASLVTGLAFAAPSSAQSPQIQAFLDQISAPFEDLREGIFGSAPNNGKDIRQGRSSSGYQAFNKSFTIGGPLNLSNDPVMQVRGDDPTYLQAAIMDEYDGKGWIATYQDAPLKNELIFPQLSLAANQTLPTSPDKGRVNNRLKVTMLQNNIPTLFTGGDPVSVDRVSLLAFHWEPIVIKADLDEIQVRQIGVGTDGRPRNLLVDTTTGKPIPPDLLPLVRALKQAQSDFESKNPPRFQVTIERPNPQAAWRVVLNQQISKGYSAIANPDGTFALEYGNWRVKLPPVADLDRLTRAAFTVEYGDKRGGNKYFMPTEPVRKDGNNRYIVTGRGVDNINQDAFEQTPLGKEIKIELDRLKTNPQRSGESQLQL
jgi:TgpA N-terminal domain